MRASAVFALALPVLAAATALPRNDGNCDTANQYCCNEVQSSSLTSIQQLAGLLGISLGNLGALVGLTCSSISVLAIAGNSCTQQPVCCTGNSFNGVLAFGCSPLNLNL